MRKVGVARGVLLTTRDALLGLIAFTIIAIAILAKSTAAAPVAFSDFLAMGGDSSIFLMLNSATTPISPSAQQVSDIANMFKAAVPVAPSASDVVFQRTDKMSAVVLLAFIFSAAVAFMLTFLRHLRRVHVISYRH